MKRPSNFSEITRKVRGWLANGPYYIDETRTMLLHGVKASTANGGVGQVVRGHKSGGVRYVTFGGKLLAYDDVLNFLCEYGDKFVYKPEPDLSDEMWVSAETI